MDNKVMLILPALIVINIFSFAFVGWDKKSSINQEHRVPEVYFFLLGTLFGSLGVFLGFFIFRHKTKKIHLPLGMAILLLEQVSLIYLLTKAAYL
jgi:uncharacterized membrane protein YsdA (DUF1294 family)